MLCIFTIDFILFFMAHATYAKHVVAQTCSSCSHHSTLKRVLSLQIYNRSTELSLSVSNEILKSSNFALGSAQF